MINTELMWCEVGGKTVHDCGHASCKEAFMTTLKRLKQYEPWPVEKKYVGEKSCIGRLAEMLVNLRRTK